MANQPQEQTKNLSALFIRQEFRDLRQLIFKYANVIEQHGAWFFVDNAWTPKEPKYSGVILIEKSRRAAFLNNTRLHRAHLLRDHIMHWRYDEIVKLVKFDPEVLKVPLLYRMNRWQKEDQAEQLSALEYAWLAGDENLIDLFEPLVQLYLKAPQIKARKDDLCTRSIAMRTELSQKLKAYAERGDWDDIRPAWLCAPHWVLGLAAYCNSVRLSGKTTVADLDVFSNHFRHFAAICGYGGFERVLYRWVADYLSESPTRSISHLRNQI